MSHAVLVTGALGHIGSSLIRHLPNVFPGATFYLVDNLSTSRYASLFNLNPLIDYKYIQDNVENIENSLSSASIDYVIHLAALTEPSLSFREPERFQTHNLRGTRYIIDFCLKKEATLIFPSSTSVYGLSGYKLNEETPTNLDTAQSPYAKCKLLEEDLILSAIKTHAIQAYILRLGTIFGTSPGMRFHTAVNRFCWDAGLCRPLSVWETAMRQYRPYLDVNDATRAISHIMTENSVSTGIYNVATINSTVYDIINLINIHCPSLQVQTIKNDVMNDLSYTVSTKKLTSTSFNFKGSLKHSIYETLNLFTALKP